MRRARHKKAVMELFLIPLLYLPGHLLARRIARKGDGLAELVLLRLAMGAALAGPVLVLLALAGWFTFPAIAASVGFLSVVALVLGRGRARGSVRACRWDFGVGALVAGSFGLYAARPVEAYLNYRDPGVYAIVAARLARTGEYFVRDPLVAAALPFHPFADGKKYPGFYVHGEDLVVPQFLPGPFAWLGMGDLVGGFGGSLYVVPVFGALSVGLACVLGRELFGRWAGMLGAALLALNYTQVWWARHPSSEVMAQFFVLGGLWTGVRFLRGGGGAGTGLLAAALVGGAMLVRVDAFVALAAVSPMLLYGYVSRRAMRRYLMPLAVVALFGVGTALYLGTVGSHYGRILYEDHGLREALQLAPLAAVGLAFAGGAAFFARRNRQPGRFLEAHGGDLALLGAVGVVSAVVWARFFWPVPWEELPMGSAGFGAYRSWVVARASWFLTPPVSLLGLVGLVLAARRLDGGRVLVIGAGLGFGLLYVALPNVAPDLPWATRRFVPAVFPVLCLLAGYAVVEAGRAAGRLRGTRAGVLTGALLAAGALGWTVSVSLPIFGHGELRGSAASIQRLDAEIPGSGVVFMELPERFDHYASPLEYLYDRPVLAYDRERFEREAGELRKAGLLRDAVYVTAYKDGWFQTPPSVGGFGFEQVGESRLELSRLSPSLREVPTGTGDLRVTFRVYELRER